MASNFHQVQFKAGSLILSDDSSSYPVASLSDVTVEHSSEEKMLPSDNQMSALSIRTSQKVTVKAKLNRVVSSRLHAALFGGTDTGTALLVVERESHDAATTVTASGTVVDDLGVLDNDGEPMTIDQSSPAVGYYARTGNDYTFNAGQTGKVYLSYTKTAGAGDVVTVSQQEAAPSPSFEAWCYNTTKQVDGTTRQVAYHFFGLVPSKLSAALKRGDFAGSDIDFECIAVDGEFFEVHTSVVS